jgi:hypothetical protein
LFGKREEKRPLGGRIILKLALEKQDAVVWTGFIWLRRGGFSSRTQI